jgi:hypothetical protein
MVMVALALLAVWPAFSRAWTLVLRRSALAVAPGGVAIGPEVAPPLLLAALIAIVGLRLHPRVRVCLFAGAAISTLAVEAFIVIVAARFGLATALTAGAGALVRDVVPLLWLFYGLVVARRAPA